MRHGWFGKVVYLYDYKPYHFAWMRLIFLLIKSLCVISLPGRIKIMDTIPKINLLDIIINIFISFKLNVAIAEGIIFILNVIFRKVKIPEFRIGIYFCSNRSVNHILFVVVLRVLFCHLPMPSHSTRTLESWQKYTIITVL